MLRIRTGYSFRAATGHLEEVLARLETVSLSKIAPITDRGSTFGWQRWGKLATEKGWRPAFGVELAVTPSLHAPKIAYDYWLFIARKNIAPINRLVELATEQFRYQPLLSVEDALAAAKDVSVVMGHRPQIDWAAKPRKNVYQGLSPAATKGLIRAALAAGYPLAATGDNVYTDPGDRAFYETLVGRGAQMQTYPQHILTLEEWRAAVAHLDLSKDQLKAATFNSQLILKASVAELKKAQLPEPERPATLRKLCEAGAKRLNCNLKDKVYKARLDKELKLIEAKGYQDYFYIVADLCQWARSKMIVGPARGSSCGSLVCYLLEITAVDPIPYGLIFERFVDINRVDMPDVDIDFSDQQRHLVFEYLANKYGPERVARLGVTTAYQPRSALKEVGGALRIPPWETEKVVDSLIERSSADSRAMQTLEDTLAGTVPGRKFLKDHPEAKLVTRFEGHPRHYSQHAAGVVLAATPITDYVAIDRRTGATMCDKDDAEKYNLLKIDALGLTQLSVFEDCLEMVGEDRDRLASIPLDDPKAFQVLNDGKFAGIFQFNGPSLQHCISMFTARTFEDIVSVTALARPGPLASGGTTEWIARKQGRKPVAYPHPIFEPYLKDTLGIVIFQEQVMELARNVGGLSWADTSSLRKAMSKSMGKEFFDGFGDPWKKEAIRKGVEPAMAAKVWDDLCAYGAWSFNKSHAVAYGLISYWCAWLKAHHPYEFAAASLTHEKVADQQLKLLRELVDEGATYRPVDAERSMDKWVVAVEEGRKVLIGPLQMVKGIGPKLLSAILSARARGEPLTGRAKKLLDTAETPIDSLYPIRDAFARVLPDPLEKNIHSSPTAIASIKGDREQTVVLFCTLSRINPRNKNELQAVARRGYELRGLTDWLHLRFQDDTGYINGGINPEYMKAMGASEIIDRGRPGKCLYAVKGLIRPGKNDGLWLNVQRVKYIGDVDDEATDVRGDTGPDQGAEQEVDETCAA